MSKKILIGILSFLIVIFLVCVCTSQTTKKQPLKQSIDSLYDAYNCAEEYSENYINKRDYQLYGIEAEYDENMIGTWTFTYTKRIGFFRDVYFVVINNKENTIELKKRSEANRMYGNDYTIAVEKWIFNENIVEFYGKSIEYDAVWWQSVNETEVVVHYLNNGERVYDIRVNPITNEIGPYLNS